MKKKGISLIVLIITIVVIIILATAIIVNIAQTNLIENANEAVVKQDFKAFQDELTMYIADKYVDMQGKFKAEDLDEKDSTKILEIIPSIKGTKYEGYIEIEDGKLTVLETMPEPDKTWAMEALGLNNKPTGTQGTPVVEIGTKVENANSTITGKKFAYNNPVIPVGFKTVNTDDASWNDTNNDGIVDDWNNGLVVQDDDMNEFVWVPVDCTDIEYEKWCTIGVSYEETTDDTEALPNGITSEIAQISTYGGFYIGRYEAGVPANQTAIDGISKETSDVEGIPVVQKEATVWTRISYNNAMSNAKKLYENSTNVRSGIVTGTEWDIVMKWVENSEISVTDSTSWGNYINSITPANVTGYGEKQVTGYSEYWKAKNIYDLAGNTFEWTGEFYDVARSVTRGGYYLVDGSDYPASYRYGNDSSDTSAGISFRLVLYVM